MESTNSKEVINKKKSILEKLKQDAIDLNDLTNEANQNNKTDEVKLPEGYSINQFGEIIRNDGKAK